jgi:hypothetical protein
LQELYENRAKVMLAENIIMQHLGEGSVCGAGKFFTDSFI